MDFFQAIVLAIVQGIVEFLPISSSAHLILVPEILGWTDQGLAFDVAVHVGTLLAVVVFLRKEIGQIVPAWLVGWKTYNWTADGQLGWLIIIATIPVGLIGLVFKDYIELNLRSSMVIAITTVFFGLVLGWADQKAEKNTKTIQNLDWRQTLVVGFAQAIALIPGTSRSGITMTAMLALGYTRIAAARFSFLMAIPAIALPGLLKANDLASADTMVSWSILTTGVCVSALVAFLCMNVFIRFVDRVGMMPFVVYRILLGLAIIVLLN